MIQAVVAIVVSMLVMVGCNPVVTVQPNEVGVVFDLFTGELGDPLLPGTHLINPLADEVTRYSTAPQELTLAGTPCESVCVLFADNEEAALDVIVLYSVNPEAVNLIHSRWYNRYAWDFVAPVTRAVIRGVAAKYTAEQAVTNLRADFEDDIRNQLGDELADEGFILIDFLIRDVTFSQRFSDMIEQRLLATMTAEAVTVTPSP